MNLYSITSDNRRELHVVAASQSEAVDIFVTFEASRGRFHDGLTIKNHLVMDLGAEQVAQVLDALAFGVSGVLHYDEDLGWVFSAPLCTPVSRRVLPVAGGE
ncbi:hypothetical protein V6R86_10745 [Sphingomonas kaistensis]|uniref:DUF3240 domain-containing protein n=1 Tax=Sphingomonas kaistensis TaxID=298708 RepID=A0ABZ2G2J8_9SPHN